MGLLAPYQILLARCAGCPLGACIYFDSSFNTLSGIMEEDQQLAGQQQKLNNLAAANLAAVQHQKSSKSQIDT